jgi:AcrR family transcriptional regulator
MPRKARSQAGSEPRRREILDAALASFLEYGFAETTIEDLRTRSGASIGSIYHHFGNKEGVAAALYAEALGDFQKGFLEALENCTTAEETVRTMVGYTLHWATGYPDWARYLFEAHNARFGPAAERAARELNRAFFPAVEAAFRPFVAKGDIARLPFNLTYAIILGPAQELCRLWLAGLHPEKPIKAESMLAEAAWNAIRAQPALL